MFNIGRPMFDMGPLHVLDRMGYVRDGILHVWDRMGYVKDERLNVEHEKFAIKVPKIPYWRKSPAG
jgi:hypothetical protein